MHGDAAINQPTLPYIQGEPVRWRHLTPSQRISITNGCGGKGGWFKPPAWIFTASCRIHDLNYIIGHTVADRRKADWQFYQAMLEDVRQAPWYKRWWYKTMAWTYYQAVRWFAGNHFYYADKERTLEDLEALAAS